MRNENAFVEAKISSLNKIRMRLTEKGDQRLGNPQSYYQPRESTTQ